MKDSKFSINSKLRKSFSLRDMSEVSNERKLSVFQRMRTTPILCAAPVRRSSLTKRIPAVFSIMKTAGRVHHQSSSPTKNYGCTFSPTNAASLKLIGLDEGAERSAPSSKKRHSLQFNSQRKRFGYMVDEVKEERSYELSVSKREPSSCIRDFDEGRISVIIVEDSELLRKFYTRIFATLEVLDVVAYESGEQFIKQWAITPLKTTKVLVLLDDQLPGMRGVQVVTAIAQHCEESNVDLPDIYICSGSKPESLREGFPRETSFVEGIIQKPLTRCILEKIISDVRRNNRRIHSVNSDDHVASHRLVLPAPLQTKK